MNDLALSSIELCAGVGMLGEGVRAAFEFLGIEHRTVCYVEREAPAASQLVALMEAGALDPAPVWSDMLTFRGRDWRGKVGCVIAGFPCQDLSIAGRRAGLNAKRSGLFFRVLDIADDCGAWLMLLENVAGIATATASVVDEAEGALDERAAARVLGELADRGWDSEWITLSASDVGASHGRARWFCLAWRRELANPEGGQQARRECGREGRPEPGRAGPDVADAGRGGARRIESQRLGRCGNPPEHQPGGAAVVDAARDGDIRQDRQAGLGRGVREAGDSMAHAERAERGPVGIGGTGCLQGNDRGRREADGGAGVADAALALATGDGWNEGRAQPGREQGRPDAAECGCAVADAQCARRAQAGRGPDLDAGGQLEPRCGCVADAREPRLPGAEQPVLQRARGGV